MRRVLLFLFVLSMGSAKAQDVLITDSAGVIWNSDTIEYEAIFTSQEIADTTILMKFEKAYIKNNSNIAIDLRVERQALSYPSGINDQLCWGGLCEQETFPFIARRSSLLSKKMQPQQIIAGGGLGFAGYYMPKGNYGVGYFKYIFYDINNQVNPAYFTVKFDVQQFVGIKEQDIFNNFSISPNPANDYVELNNLPKKWNSNASIEVLNIIGKVVSEKTIGKTEKHRIDVSNLKSGIYFIRLKADGQYSRSQKLIIR